MSDDEDVRVTIARHDERLKTAENKIKSIDGKLWAAVLAVAAWVLNKLLGLLQIGGMQ